MRILLFGRNGQVGGAFTSLALPEGCDLVALDRAAADLSDPASVGAAVRSHRPDVVVNAAAYTAVDKAESEPDLAHAVNAAAPGAMAEACEAVGAALVHISTDYVFDGTKDGAYHPEDAVGPRSVYGESKLRGEDAIRAATDRAVILRTSWVYGPRGGNFVKTMLRLGATREELGVVDDQYGRPTLAEDIARACRDIALKLSERPAFGTYHFAGDTPMTWCGFARDIFEIAREEGLPAVKRLNAITTADYPTPAARPANSDLCPDKVAEAFGVRPTPHRAALAGCIRAIATAS